MSRSITAILAFSVTALFATGASAADTWTDPAPGIRQLVRTAPGPLRYVAVTIDLSRPEYFIRVTHPDERGQTVSGWANSVGAVAAINGDWFESGYQPVGLAVGNGTHWPGSDDVGWSFMACTIEKECVFDDFTTDQGRYHRWHEVVGGNGWRLLIDGNIPNYPADAFYTARHPRSGVGISQDGKTMILAVVEGRRGDSIGLGFADFGQFFKDLGAYQAMMLDGGGSSALAVNGSRVSRLPSNQGSERVVANHIGILGGTADARCNATPNGRYCDDSVIHTCRGGGHLGSGDCGAFGASCEVTSDGIGVCVHPYCTGGANGAYCEDDTHIVQCDYGAPGDPGDCAAFGATCETGEENSYCVHYMCSEGGNATWCRDADVLATCVDGQPQDDVDCSAEGKVCSEGACVEPSDDDPVDEDPTMDDGDEMTDGDGGPSNDDESSDDDSGSPTSDEDEPSGDAPEDEMGVVTADGEAGCQTSRGSGPAPLLMLLFCLGLIRAARLSNSSDQ